MSTARAMAMLAVAAAAFLCAGCGGDSSSESATEPLSSLGQLEPAPPPGDLSGELVPVPDAQELAPAASQATTAVDVDGIKCEHNAELIFHVHAHVTVFVDGKPRAIPAGVGIYPPLVPANYRPSPIGPQFGQVPGQCLSWLSTRYADGLIHVESSEQRTFTLGDFFAVWGQPLSKTELGPEQGEVTAIVDTQVWTGDPAEIPLGSHTQIQLMLGEPLVAPQTIEFPGAF